MERPICYDITRLITRVVNKTPNGIDRVDLTLAQHFLAAGSGPHFGATSTGFGSRLLGLKSARDVLDAIAGQWGEDESLTKDPVYDFVVKRLQGTNTPTEGNKPKVRAYRKGLALTLRWVGRHGLPVLKRPVTHLPNGAAYINVSQFPLWVSGSFRWLESRPDVKGVFFIHDLLPLQMPEYFPHSEFERHRSRLQNLVRFGAAALVTTTTVAKDLAEYVAGLGRADLPIFVAPTPVAPIFSGPRHEDTALARHRYFVLCSTIEPRKNHVMILAVWRDLVRRLGPSAPRLVLVGARGWKYDLIFDLIERSPPLRDHVICIGNLSTPGLKRLIDNAQALLMPTFAEGYGLPVHEALATGAPVIASDIPVFRDLTLSDITLLSPLDGEAWLSAVHDRAISGRPPGEPSSRQPTTAGDADYFRRLDAFIAAL